MSHAKLEEIRCPCGEIFEAELWNALNVFEDPDLKEALLSGEINVVCCPVCRQIFYAENFVLYQDHPSELLAFVYPSGFADQAAFYLKRMKEDFHKAIDAFEPSQRINYEPILLFGLDALVEIVREEDEASDEVTILEYMAKELGLSLIRLHPALARQKQIPRLIPKSAGKFASAREAIIAGLHALLKHNEHLTRYKKLLHTLEHDKKWELPKGLVIEKTRASH